MNEAWSHREDIEALEASIGHTFLNPTLLLEALTHPSYVNENPSAGRDNQRMEFLGDSVVGLVIAQTLFERFSTCNEGALTLALARVVCEPALAEVAASINLGAFIRMGRGESYNGGRERPALLADAYEALVAAVYLDAGLEAARDMLMRLHQQTIEATEPARAALDFKSHLQKVVQSAKSPPPAYRIVAESGPAHERWFTAEVVVDGEGLARGEGRTKKEAEQQAACAALELLEQQNVS